MKFKVTKTFRDKYTKEIYQAGDVITLVEDEKRAEDLLSRKLISFMEPTIRHVGGGWYELPSGERVQGKQAALDMMGGD